MGAVLTLCLAAACASPRVYEQPIAPARTQFEAAVEAVAQRNLGEATDALRTLTSDCESGVWGSEALLLWSLLELDPRHQEGSPHLAARLAARHLQVPNASAASVLLSETIYLLALDLGGEPVEDPLSWREGESPVAKRFHECGVSREAAEPIRELPIHPGPVTTRASIEAAVAERDSLAGRVETLARTNALLEAELDALEAELRRIRGLLSPDGVTP